jgi:hypothetical protein
MDRVIEISALPVETESSAKVYHEVSRDHPGIPIGNFWFGGTPSESERDVAIFGVFAKSQQRNKPWLRQPPLVSQSVCA